MRTVCTLAMVGAIGAAVVPTSGHAQDTTVSAEASDLPPAGYGTLGQDDIAIRLRTANLIVGMIPLDEGIIRLLAPDTYGSMHRLLESKSDEIAGTARRYGIREPVVFLVSFFGTQPRTRFDPDALTITGQNRFFRPAAILPMSPQFSDRQLNQRQTATAIYIYEDGIRLLDPFTLSYEGVSTNRWEQTLRTLDRERASVEARAAAARKPRPRATAVRGSENGSQLD